MEDDGREGWTAPRDKRTVFTTKPVFMEPCSAPRLSLCDTRTFRCIEGGESINGNAQEHSYLTFLRTCTPYMQIFGQMRIWLYIYMYLFILYVDPRVST